LFTLSALSPIPPGDRSLDLEEIIESATKLVIETRQLLLDKGRQLCGVSLK
jgi:hypothetical protein